MQMTVTVENDNFKVIWWELNDLVEDPNHVCEPSLIYERRTGNMNLCCIKFSGNLIYFERKQRIFKKLLWHSFNKRNKYYK